MSPIFLEINLGKQCLNLNNGETCLFSCPISSGAAGVGMEQGSGKTPVGLFAICSKIGDGEAPDTIFKARVPSGHFPSEIPAGMNEKSDFILTRILWLDGREAANSNTRERYIYIHGTNRTDLLGTPSSHGCIRLSPQDMLTLFDLTEEGMAVEIRS